MCAKYRAKHVEGALQIVANDCNTDSNNHNIMPLLVMGKITPLGIKIILAIIFYENP